MAKKWLRTSDIARAAGVHPNTVRLYEEWGFLPTVPRSESGYRRFSEAHLHQMLLARGLLHEPWPGQAIRRSAIALVKHAATGDLGGALERAYRHLALVRAERVRAEAAIALLERWANGAAADAVADPLHIGRAAAHLGVTVDMLRNWERNGLLETPRDPRNGYRLYGAPELGRLRVIRMLRDAGYSPMAILRMLRRLDEGQTRGLREALDTPRDDEDVFMAADRWLSALDFQESCALDAIARLEIMIERRFTSE
ncbi:MAG: MerR family transcriptional regulator [Anaerolineae bacterium]|nr:MerR family transcriptional regulator [Anaerolineae bacterium]